jgi:FkbM family methyltransferase
MTSGVPRRRYPGQRLLRLFTISRNPFSAVSLLVGRDRGWQGDFRVGRLVLTARRTDIGAISDVAIEDDYGFLRGLPFPGADALVLDIGANIGCFAALILSICPDAEVHSVEPSPDTFALLARNRGRYPTLRWHVHQSAIAARSGTLCFHNDGLSPSRRLSTGSDGVPVRAEAFDMFVSRVAQGRRVFLCKMDIEGTEVPVFSGAMNMLAQVEHFVVEVHGSGAHTDLVTAKLSKAFQNVQMVPGRSSSKPLIHAWRDRPAQGQDPRKDTRSSNLMALTA